MNSYQKDKNNLGGIAKLWCIPARLISSLPFSTPDVLYPIPAGWEDEAWEFEPVFQSASFSEDMKPSPAGSYYEPTVTFKIPKTSGQSQEVINMLKLLRTAILLLDQNGQYFLVGNEDYPMRLSTGSRTGADVSDLNHIAFTYTGKNLHPSIFAADPFA
jgi:hypothetical protein